MTGGILLCLIVAGPRMLRIETYVVVSGSMEPANPVGTMIYAKKVEPSALEVGDVIVFYNTDATSDAVPITHRVVENRKASGEIITKGDANSSNDMQPVIYNNVLGKVIFKVAGLGFAASILSTIRGKIAAVMIIIAAYLLTEIGGRIRR